MKFEFVAGNLALDFANSVHDHGSPDPQDDLKTCEDLLDWSHQAGLLSQRERRALQAGKPVAAKAEFEHSVKLREAIYAIFLSHARGKPAPREALRRFNWHLQKAAVGTVLQKAGEGFELTLQQASPLQRVRGEITRAAVSLLTSDHLPRVRQCAGESCTWLFLDSSRNGLRRWCDMQACGNRSKVRRFRKRNASL